MDKLICDELIELDQKLNSYDHQYYARGAEQLLKNEEGLKILGQLSFSTCAFDIITSITAYLGPRLTSYLLYKEDKSEYYEKVKIALQLALSEGNPYSNSIIFRNEDYGCRKVIDWFNARINRIVKFPFFLSCSKEKFSNKNLHYQIVTSSNSSARDAMPLLMILEKVKAENEKEVLMNYGTNFMVKGANDMDEIYLEEIAEVDTSVIVLEYNFWEK